MLSRKFLISLGIVPHGEEDDGTPRRADGAPEEATFPACPPPTIDPPSETRQCTGVVPIERERWPNEVREQFEERVAIMEFEGGLHRQEAESLAFVLLSKRSATSTSELSVAPTKCRICGWRRRREERSVETGG